MNKMIEKPPFSFLPKPVMKDLFNQFSNSKIDKDTIVISQEVSSVEKFLVLSEGTAQYYYEHHNTKTLRGRLREGDNFGGISILLNDSVAIRTLEVFANSTILELDVDIFLKLCTEYDEFQS